MSARVWNFLRQLGPEIKKEVKKRAPDFVNEFLNKPDVKQVIVVGDGDPDHAGVSKANQDRLARFLSETPPRPDISAAYLLPRPMEDTTRARQIDRKNLYCFGGGVGVGVTIGYLIWGRGGGGN